MASSQLAALVCIRVRVGVGEGERAAVVHQQEAGEAVAAH